MPTKHPGRPHPSRQSAAVFALLSACLGLWGSTLVTGCANDAPEVRETGPKSISSELDDAPAWVLRGCASLSGSGARLVCGVGSMGATRSPTLARSTAIGRARTEIARNLQTKLQAMLKDQQVSAGARMTGEAAEQQIIDVSKQITQLSLSGTELRDTWTSPQGAVFALMVLDLDRFEASVRAIASLPPGVREAVEEGAPAAFEPDEANDTPP